MSDHYFPSEDMLLAEPGWSGNLLLSSNTRAIAYPCIINPDGTARPTFSMEALFDTMKRAWKLHINEAQPGTRESQHKLELGLWEKAFMGRCQHSPAPLIFVNLLVCLRQPAEVDKSLDDLPATHRLFQIVTPISSSNNDQTCPRWLYMCYLGMLRNVTDEFNGRTNESWDFFRKRDVIERSFMDIGAMMAGREAKNE